MVDFRSRIICCALILLFCLISAGCGSSSDSKSAETGLSAASEEFPNGDLLVTSNSLQSNLHRKNIVVIDARSSGYSDSHIPGAINLKYGDYFTVGSGLLPVSDLEARLSAAGVRSDMTFVIYDDTTASWGAAGRLFWMLEYLGCPDVHILNGGWDKWIADGRPTESGIVTLPPDTFAATVNGAVRAEKSHVLDRLYDSDFVVIDARTDEEYIGWQLYGETRGGHIPGAVQIPYAWFFKPDKTLLGYTELKALFESRGVTADKEVTSYCTAGIRSGFVYFALRLLGYPRASNYDGSIAEWSADTSLPMEKLPHYEKLVHPGWVRDLIDEKNVTNAPAGRYVIAGTSNLLNVATFIPSSIFINPTEWELRGSIGQLRYGSGNLWPDPTLKTAIESWGIDRNTTVIVYSITPGNPDPSVAVRLVWLLMYAGVEDVRLLNGGIDAWTANGFAVSSVPAERTPVSNFLTGLGTFPLHPEYLAKTEYIEEVVAGLHADAVLADIRTWDEYTGSSESFYPSIGIPLTAVGRIPGSLWGHWGPGPRGGGDFWDAYDGTLRSYPEVRKFWADWGIKRNKTISFY